MLKEGAHSDRGSFQMDHYVPRNRNEVPIVEKKKQFPVERINGINGIPGFINLKGIFCEIKTSKKSRETLTLSC